MLIFGLNLRRKVFYILFLILYIKRRKHVSSGYATPRKDFKKRGRYLTPQGNGIYRNEPEWAGIKQGRRKEWAVKRLLSS